MSKKKEEENLPAAQEPFKSESVIAGGHELQVASSTALAVQEVQATIIVAKHFPRNADQVWQNVTRSCQRRSMAEKAAYSYPRGGGNITGPSVYLARIIASHYGNLRFGVDIQRDDEDSRLIRGWCWDVENNTKVHFDDEFQKLIYRKKDGWIKPDERDLRELTNRRGAILMRNAIFNVIPRDLIEDALHIAKESLKSSIKDPEGEKKNLILALDKLCITVEMMNEYLGHDTWNADDMVYIRGIINSIEDGNAKVNDYFGKGVEVVAEGNLKVEDAKKGDPETHQGHETQGEVPPGVEESYDKDKQTTL